MGCVYWGCECRAVGCGMVGRVQGVAVRCGWVYRKGRACIDRMVEEKKEGEEGWKDWSCAR